MCVPGRWPVPGLPAAAVLGHVQAAAATSAAGEALHLGRRLRAGRAVCLRSLPAGGSRLLRAERPELQRRLCGNLSARAQAFDVHERRRLRAR